MKELFFLAIILNFHKQKIILFDFRNEDIKDVLLSVIHMLHGTQDKLERHEMREKQLGEIVKRALGGLEKRHRGLEPIKGLLERLDERLAGVETVLMQVLF